MPTAAFPELVSAGLAVVVVESCSDGATAILSGISEKKRPQCWVAQDVRLVRRMVSSSDSIHSLR